LDHKLVIDKDINNLLIKEPEIVAFTIIQEIVYSFNTQYLIGSLFQSEPNHIAPDNSRLGLDLLDFFARIPKEAPFFITCCVYTLIRAIATKLCNNSLEGTDMLQKTLAALLIQNVKSCITIFGTETVGSDAQLSKIRNFYSPIQEGILSVVFFKTLQLTESPLPMQSIIQQYVILMLNYSSLPAELKVSSLISWIQVTVRNKITKQVLGTIDPVLLAKLKDLDPSLIK